jgi:hypothetical protein
MTDTIALKGFRDNTQGKCASFDREIRGGGGGRAWNSIRLPSSFREYLAAVENEVLFRNLPLHHGGSPRVHLASVRHPTRRHKFARRGRADD